MRNLFASLLALPNLAAAFESTSMLFLPGGLWSKTQRLVSSMGQDATATTWAVTCTQNASATTACDIPPPYMVYTMGDGTMQMSVMQMNVMQSQPSYDIACTLNSMVAGICSGNVAGIAFTTTMNADYLSSYGYREVTITDSFPANLETSAWSTSLLSKTSSTTSTSGTGCNPAKYSVSKTSLAGPLSIPTGLLVGFPTATGTSTSATGTVASNSKSAGGPPAVTGAMRIVAAVAMVGGAIVL